MNTRRYPLRASAARASMAIEAHSASETNGRVSSTPKARPRPKRINARSTTPGRKRRKTGVAGRTVVVEDEVENAKIIDDSDDIDKDYEGDDRDEGEEGGESDEDNEGDGAGNSHAPSRRDEKYGSVSSGCSVDDEVLPSWTRKARSSRSKPLKGRKGRSKPIDKEQSIRKGVGPHGNIAGEVGSPKETGLDEHQLRSLDKYFSEFDLHKNGRFTIADIRRVADDYGMDVTPGEAANMMRFWDTLGTNTISRDAFTQLAIDSKFLKLTGT